jgi:hypothetical protein
MARRLFHAIVLVGTGMAAACSSGGSETPVVTDSGSAADTKVADSGAIDTFPSIMPMKADSAPDDTGAADTRTDTFPTIMADTFPGIMPPPADAFPPIA